MSNVTPEIRKLTDQMRSKGHRPDALSILKEAKAQNIPIDLEQMRLLVMQEGKASGLIFRPDFIPAFIASYLQDSAPQTILDCWAGIGGMLSPLVQRFEPSVAIGINQHISEHEAANLLHGDKTIDWKLGEPLQLLDEIDTRFDVVVGCPPFACPPTSLTLSWDNNLINLHDDLGNILLLKTCQLLEPEGVGFFIVSSSFLREQRERKVYTHLEHFGLFIDAALSLPSGTFAPLTQIESLLLIIRRQKPLRLFVGELKSDQTSNVLLQNLKARKRGKTFQLGTLVDSTSFRSFSTLVAEYEIKELAKGLGLSPTPLSEICTAINLPKRIEGEEFSDLPNAVYLPIIGRAPAVYSLFNLKIKPQNYIQLVLNPNKAIAEYVANFLNTALGQKIRESLVSGTFIPKINKSQLVNAAFYLPQIEIQSKIVGVQSIITDLSTQLDSLQRKLWNHPQRYKEMQKDVGLLNHVDNFETWVESLPFPLASILWAYHADNNVKDKIDHLFLFFEALSQFTAVVMLSAYAAADKAFYMKHSGAWREQDSKSKFKDWVLKSTFGGWINLGRNLAKTTRRLKEDKKNKERLLELFGRPEHDFLEMLTNKEIFNELDAINKHRNEWKGHGGAANSQEYTRRLTLLESNLAKVRQVITNNWETALLLLPDSSKYSGGIYDYQVKELKGTRTPFKKIMVKTRYVMEDEKLYLLHANQQTPVELVPFVRMLASPNKEQNACYFYNRQEGNKVRWVSYHFDSQPEVYRSAEEVTSAISLICPPEDNTENSLP
ncbi:hypothetical protein QUA62_26065 [Microcoleus sp. MON1_C1]|uniref:hypothetical protein n=1 Tax=Microcoleus sp. MON1_C1 TaxID=2818827 RepID=UPI002FCF5A09